MDPTAKEILFILTDEPSLQIMNLLEKKEQSVRAISSTLHLPISSTYKKIKKLEGLKLLRVAKVVRTLDGMDETFYTLSIKEIRVTYRNDTLSFDIQQKAFDDKIIRLWQKFKN
jgi:predicted transcriptional regulator